MFEKLKLFYENLKAKIKAFGSDILERLLHLPTTVCGVIVEIAEKLISKSGWISEELAHTVAVEGLQWVAVIGGAVLIAWKSNKQADVK